MPAPAGYAGVRYNNDVEAMPASRDGVSAGGGLVAGDARTYTIDLSEAAESREGK